MIALVMARDKPQNIEDITAVIALYRPGLENRDLIV